MKAFATTINGSIVSLEVFQSSDLAISTARKIVDEMIANHQQLLELEKCGFASGISSTLNLLHSAVIGYREIELYEVSQNCSHNCEES